MCDTFANKITLPKTKASRYVALQVWPVHHGTLGGVCCSLRVGERTIGPRPQVKRRCATFHGKEISHTKDFPEVARHQDHAQARVDAATSQLRQEAEGRGRRERAV